MAVTLKCADCGYSAQSEDETPRTCPQCEGTMKKPAYKAKRGPTSSDKDSAKARPAAKADEPKSKPAARSAPAKKGEPLPLDEDDDGEKPKKGGGGSRDDAAAKSLEIDPGFGDKKLMRQVEEELSRGEVLHWAGRMCPEIAEKGARTTMFVGIGVAAVGVLFSAIAFAVAPWFVGLIPLVFVAVGTALAVLGPKVARKKAELAWYAITSRRAIVFIPSAFGSGGETKTYEPDQLRRLRVNKSAVVDGAGDLIFKTTVHERRTDYVDRNTGQTTRSETSRHEIHEGFLGIENVREVETLVHNVLLGGKDDDEDDE